MPELRHLIYTTLVLLSFSQRDRVFYTYPWERGYYKYISRLQDFIINFLNNIFTSVLAPQIAVASLRRVKNDTKRK